MLGANLRISAAYLVKDLMMVRICFVSDSPRRGYSEVHVDKNWMMLFVMFGGWVWTRFSSSSGAFRIKNKMLSKWLGCCKAWYIARLNLAHLSVAWLVRNMSCIASSVVMSVCHLAI